MAIPKVKREDIIAALNYIDEKKVPRNNQSRKYELVTEDRKRYSIKYVIAVADHLANGTKISTKGFTTEDAKRYLKGQGFTIDSKNQNESQCVVNDNNGTSKEEHYRNPFSSMVIESKNVILRGAPGTGKTHLAKEIAADIVSGGTVKEYASLSDEQKQQIEFVQFHPSYDYTDFVEGLRPQIKDDGTMYFKLEDGIFKKFVNRARENCENYNKDEETIAKEISIQNAISEFLSTIEFGVDTFKTTRGSKFTITDATDKTISIFIPENLSINTLILNIDEIRRMLESEEKFEKAKDITSFVGIKTTQQRFSYDLAIYNEIIKLKKNLPKKDVEHIKRKEYIFIIDEINRGEISKIFGELFFAIDPGYRGHAGEITTQYANLRNDSYEKFYIPDNVYIIGTMNDIDRSVDSFDFAMRRRFRFVNIGVKDRLNMLDSLNEDVKKDAIKRMDALNNKIISVEDLNEDYQIGAAYFLKLDKLGPDKLWTDCLQPLLQEYVRGMYNEKDIMNGFKEAYGYSSSTNGDINEIVHN